MQPLALAHTFGNTLHNCKKNIVQLQLIERVLRGVTRIRLSLGRIALGETTVVIVNWNSEEFLDVTLNAVTLNSPPGTRVVVVDNQSTDNSREVSQKYPMTRWIGLPYNVGHGLALDVGFLLARTEYVVSLDVDAFPVSPQWIDRLIAPLEGGYAVAEAHMRGGFVHPCCLAMKLDRFVEMKHSFVPRYGHRLARSALDSGAPGWDTGCNISMREP